MSKRIVVAGVLVAALLSGAGLVAFAQEKQSISTVVSSGVKGQLVQVEARVVGKVDENIFKLEDDTGSINMSLGPRWFATHELQVGSTVQVMGEVDRGKDGSKPAELDANSVTQQGGAVLEIRPATGKPPWAGGPKIVGEKHPGYRGTKNSTR